MILLEKLDVDCVFRSVEANLGLQAVFTVLGTSSVLCVLVAITSDARADEFCHPS